MGRAEVIFASCCFVVFSTLWAFVELAEEVSEGDTRFLDEKILLLFRRPDDLATPVGPVWFRDAGVDITALGSHAVVVLVVASVACGLALQRQYRAMVLVLASSIGGTALSTSLKVLFHRDRPSIIPHLREVSTSSFPSGHATLSAVVYLTLGIVLAEVLRGRIIRGYCLAVATVVVFAVGSSRVYLGVHYPSDVLGGWALGFSWALVCWAVADYLKRRGFLRRSMPDDEAERLSSGRLWSHE